MELDLTVPSTIKINKISDELSSLYVPEFDSSVITAGYNKVLRELEASDCTLVLVGTMQSVEAVASAHIPYLIDGRESSKWDKSKQKTRGGS